MVFLRGAKNDDGDATDEDEDELVNRPPHHTMPPHAASHIITYYNIHKIT